MGIDCGSQVVLCEYPIRLDTYKGCSHACTYCFARSKNADLSDVRPLHCADAVRRFAAGARTASTRWCDWDIPLHWGGMSDPFQPAERVHGASLEVLRALEETQHPAIVSTKGRLIAEEPYLSAIGRCRIVVQISMTSPMLDGFERGAPTFEERIGIGRAVAPHCLRLIARVQPYLPQARDSLVSWLPAMAEAGFHGITVEGLKTKKRKRGMVREGGDWCYPQERLASDYAIIREECRRLGLGFWCAENRLRHMGDSTACCGCGDLEGFRGNAFNAVSILAGGVVPRRRP